MHKRQSAMHRAQLEGEGLAAVPAPPAGVGAGGQGAWQGSRQGSALVTAGAPFATAAGELSSIMHSKNARAAVVRCHSQASAVRWGPGGRPKGARGARKAYGCTRRRRMHIIRRTGVKVKVASHHQPPPTLRHTEGTIAAKHSRSGRSAPTRRYGPHSAATPPCLCVKRGGATRTRPQGHWVQHTYTQRGRHAPTAGSRL